MVVTSLEVAVLNLTSFVERIHFPQSIVTKFVKQNVKKNSGLCSFNVFLPVLLRVVFTLVEVAFLELTSLSKECLFFNQ